MHRTAYQSLLNWKSSASRKPLLMQGARQVGKTWLIREFGKKEYSDCAYFNFEENLKLIAVFENDLDPAKILEVLSAFIGKPILPQKTLIFFDEIQVCPRALTALKYFCEQASEYHVIAAGSLLGVSVGKTSSFPVGKVIFLTLYPLDFFEFIGALGEELLKEHLVHNSQLKNISELLHSKLISLFRIYLYIGGMPEVVKSYIQEKNFSAAREIQKDILLAYQRDFSKYTTPTQAVRISEIWRSIPSHLARENKKFKYGDVKKHGRASQFESAVEWLRSAGLVYTAINVSTAKLPLAAYEEHAKFKVYLLDCGLLGAIINISAEEYLLGNSALSEYNGAIVENYVACELAIKNEGVLHYWISSGIAEVDFLVTHNQKILPLEVKSGLGRNVKSLRVYADKFNPVKIFRTSPRNYECRDDFINFPLYAAGLFADGKLC